MFILPKIATLKRQLREKDGDTAAVESEHAAELAALAEELRLSQQQAVVDLEELVAKHRAEVEEYDAEVARLRSGAVEQTGLIETLTAEKDVAVKDTQAGAVLRMTHDQRMFAEERRRKAEVDAAWLRDEASKVLRNVDQDILWIESEAKRTRQRKADLVHEVRAEKIKIAELEAETQSVKLELAVSQRKLRTAQVANQHAVTTAARLRKECAETRDECAALEEEQLGFRARIQSAPLQQSHQHQHQHQHPRPTPAPRPVPDHRPAHRGDGGGVADPVRAQHLAVQQKLEAQLHGSLPSKHAH